MLKKKKNIVALSLVLQIVVVKWLSNDPEFIEQYYSNGIYPLISKLFRFTLGWLPFSFGDIIYSCAIIYIIRWFYINRKRLKYDLKNWLIDIVAALAILYGAFHILWGLNYYRLPLHKSLHLEKDYTTEQLIEVTRKLITEANNLHLSITKNDTIKVILPFTKHEILDLIPHGYDNLQTAFPHLKYHPRSIKKSLFSYPLTYMGFSGYLNPFTNEAQVDAIIPIYKFPTTAAHEVAHQLGYAAENEANFIACLSSINHDNIYFKYTGYTFGLRFCLNEIYRRDEDAYNEIVQTVNKGILKNYEEVRSFWETHQNPTEPFFKVFYNNFLKANRQSKGLQSYNYVVALLVNYFDSQ
ncbi:DUF3810 domain-containing protein [Tamlana fucoidanivorans]|uniref:DUF3810 domain-containing protein n=1 Tax=Allotamlana fucoidanivorans TaxID=2583814 RepID=A0A5C4SPN6_9FLAO|nr:DUF3810 domain-containing protein [Tamlana fucoidanivorans]TNJ45682.1 DUF3810 domain-containing protein [Tamlana fucoidanivorans]